MSRRKRFTLLLAVSIGLIVLLARPGAWAHNPDPNDPLKGAAPVLKVADFKQAVAYYRDVLGFHEEFTTGNPPDYADVSRGMVTFHLSTGKGAIEKGSIYLFVTGVDMLHDEFKRKGAEITEAAGVRPQSIEKKKAQ